MQRTTVRWWNSAPGTRLDPRSKTIPKIRIATPHGFRFNRLFHAIRLETAIGEFDTAAKLAETMSREYWETAPVWPDLSTVASVSSVAFAARALADIQHGRAEAALERYRIAWADTGNFRFDPEYYRNEYPALHRFPVLIAVLHRLTAVLRHPGTGDRR